MKQIILLFFVFISSWSAYCQVNNLEDGNQCFNQGDYICAESKYKEAFKTALGKDKQITEIKIQRAKRCIDNLKNANLAFNAKNYTKAKEFYLAILDSNPNDEYVKGQIESINSLLSSFVSKPINKSNSKKYSISNSELSFKSAGGSEYITVYFDSSSYTIEYLPSWCTVQKFTKYFIVTCNVNTQNISRKDYFNIKVDKEMIRVNILQEAAPNEVVYNLEASKMNLYFTHESGVFETIYITTNANYFDISLVPSWCYINKYSSYITVSCEKNESNYSRNDWFKVYVNNKEIKIYVTQSANPNIEIKEKKNESKIFGSFSSIGFQSGEIAKYGFIYERGGRKTVGFRITGRTSLAAEEGILNGTIVQNKTEIELGPNFNIFKKRLYFNIGLGYGFYDRLKNNDYAGELYTEKTGYTVATTGLMFRLSRVISINGGASFMDIDKDFYKPEITFGISFNLKGKYKY